MIIQDAIRELDDAWLHFLGHISWARLIFVGREPAIVAWEHFRSKCQQVSQWIEHGRATDAERIEAKKFLDRAEAVLTKYEVYKK